jgi:hypothetical protein
MTAWKAFASADSLKANESTPVTVRSDRSGANPVAGTGDNGPASASLIITEGVSAESVTVE